jgi:glycosyltransferase involved in cell wall biosynthesis
MDAGPRELMDATNRQGAPLRVVFCWTEVSGYVAACWRALAARGMHVHVLHTQQLATSEIANPFAVDPLMAGLSHEIFDGQRPDIDDYLRSALLAQQPDVIVISGWLFRPYVTAVMSRELSGARLIVGMDSPWRGTLNQRLARWRLGSLMKRTSLVITAGERSAEYARRLGLDPRRLRNGYYGYDDGPLAPVAAARDAVRWNRQFLFVGRYVAQKDLPTLIEAYRIYRTMVTNPWGLTCSGAGTEGQPIDGVDGVTNAGFTQPGDLPDLLARHGAFVIASRFEPWGVVIAEAAASGLPVICTTACGAGHDIVRPYYNGLIAPVSDPRGLAEAMRWMHEHEDGLAAMGQRGRSLAVPFNAENWAVRWAAYIEDARRS